MTRVGARRWCSTRARSLGAADGVPQRTRPRGDPTHTKRAHWASIARALRERRLRHARCLPASWPSASRKGAERRHVMRVLHLLQNWELGIGNWELAIVRPEMMRLHWFVPVSAKRQSAAKLKRFGATHSRNKGLFCPGRPEAPGGATGVLSCVEE